MEKIFDNFKIALFLLVFVWIVYIADIFIPIDLRSYGIRPRQLHGLWGILTMPFLHGNFTHITANSGALLILTTITLSFNRSLGLIAMTGIAVIGGFSVWLFGKTNTVHIGASSVIFGLIGFLLFMGFFRREWKAIILSVLVFLFYGSVLLSLLISVPGVSWSGHFFGFVAGIIIAWFTRNSLKEQKPV